MEKSAAGKNCSVITNMRFWSLIPSGRSSLSAVCRKAIRWRMRSKGRRVLSELATVRLLTMQRLLMFGNSLSIANDVPAMLAEPYPCRRRSSPPRWRPSNRATQSEDEDRGKNAEHSGKWILRFRDPAGNKQQLGYYVEFFSVEWRKALYPD